jgi:hypothetical protein
MARTRHVGCPRPSKGRPQVAALACAGHSTLLLYRADAQRMLDQRGLIRFVEARHAQSEDRAPFLTSRFTGQAVVGVRLEDIHARRPLIAQRTQYVACFNATFETSVCVGVHDAVLYDLPFVFPQLGLLICLLSSRPRAYYLPNYFLDLP